MTVASPPSKAKSEPAKSPSNREKQKAHAMGLTSSTALVVGSIVGTGVFTMPAGRHCRGRDVARSLIWATHKART